LVNARRYGGQLRIVALDETARARAAELAEIFLALAHDHIGRSREDSKKRGPPSRQAPTSDASPTASVS
jgi:hypothetical protein